MLAPRNSVLVWEEQEDLKKKNGQRYISLLVSFEHNGSSQIVSLRRQISEDFNVTATKIEQKLLQGVLGKSISQPISDDIALPVSVDSSTIEKTLKTVLDENSTLLVGEKELPIEKEPADCLSISIPLVPVVGCPSIPAVDLRSSNSNATFHWFVQPVSSQETVKNAKGKNKKEKVAEVPQKISIESEAERRFSLPGCEYRSTGGIYTPSVDDVGKRLVVVVDLGPKSVVRCGVSKHVISPIEEDLICQERMHWCATNPSNTDNLRLVTFNLLADLYLNLGLPQEELFFPYCPKEFQQYDYRYPLLLREIKGYNADIYWLQEVDARMQMRFLGPLFDGMGMEMCFEKKRKEVNEGTVIAFRRDRFRKVDSSSFWLAELLENNENEDARRVLSTSPKSLEIFSARPTILQVVVLEEIATGYAVLCANTHLHHDPKHEYIKAVQALVAIRQVEKIRVDLKAKHGRVHELFGGDFNSTPDGPVYQLFSEGCLSEEDDCWKLDKEIVPVDLKMTPRLKKYRNLTGLPEFTNYTKFPTGEGEGGFMGTLDYIFSSEDVVAEERQPPNISVDEAKKHVALPSRASPSDHIALIVDVKLQ